MLLKIKELRTISIRKILYILCTCILCLADQRIQTDSDFENVKYPFIFLVGIALTIIILSAHQLKEYLRWYIYVWVGGMLAILPFGYHIVGKRYFIMTWYTYLILWFMITLLGVALFVTIEKVFKNPPKLQWPLFFVWFGMMVLMTTSESDLLWPFLYFVIFGCLFMSDYKDNGKMLLDGVTDGLIAAFFLFQGWSFVFRPFDQFRYKGFYGNSNMNALFYLMVFCAVALKYYGAIYNNKKIGWKILYLFLMGTIISFTVLTMGRSALLAEAVVAFIVLICCIREKKWFLHILVQGCSLLLCIIISFPLAFSAARYIPPIFHHPVWFWYEYSEDAVHSWDSWDSEKYIEMDEFFEGFLGRFSNATSEISSVFTEGSKAYAADLNIKITEPVLLKDGGGESTRKIIYKYFFDILNMNGHKSDSYGVQLNEGYAVNHAHNVFLQYGTDFGIPVMILFAIYLGWLIIGGLRNLIKYGPNQKVLMGVIFALAFTCFGMFEYNWGAGRLAMIMVYFVGYTQIHAVRTNENDIHTDGIQTDNEKLETEKA